MNSLNRGVLATGAYAIFFLFFLQHLTAFIAAIYAFGLLGEGLPPELAAVTLFLSPFLLLPFRRGPSVPVTVAAVELVLLSRPVAVFLPTQAGLLVSGLGVGLGLIALPTMLLARAEKRDERAPSQMAAGLTLAVALSVAFRSAGSTMDLTEVGMFRIIALLLALAAAALIPGTITANAATIGTSEPGGKRLGLGRTIALATGLLSTLALFYFAFAAPAVTARWSDVGDLPVVAVAVAALVAFAWLRSGAPRFATRMVRNGVLPAGVLFLLSLALALALYQDALPASAAAYPLPEGQPGLPAALALLIALALFPVLFLQFEFLARELILARPAPRSLSLGFGIGSLFLLLMMLATIFTTVWAYVDPILEPVARGRFPHVHALVGLAAVAPLLAVSRDARIAGRGWPGRPLAVLVTILGLIALLAAWWRAPRPAAPDPAPPLRVAGYNVHQGYDADGRLRAWEQCQALKKAGAAIIGLSENDTARLAGGNFDLARYLAECLDMHTAIGPRTGAATFGYALLSSYPLERVETWHLYSGPGLPSADDPEEPSNGDQVAVIWAQAEVSGRIFNILVSHFDSDPPPEQPAGVASLARGLENVILVGDFNCRPGGACFDILTGDLIHCASTGGEADSPEGRVDHIFVSAGLRCPRFSYVENDASDHPLVTAEIDW